MTHADRMGVGRPYEMLIAQLPANHGGTCSEYASLGGAGPNIWYVVAAIGLWDVTMPCHNLR